MYVLPLWKIKYMLYQLYNGKTTEIPDSMYFQMDDEEFARELEDLMANDLGAEIEDAFYGSALTAKSKRSEEYVDSEDDYEDTTLDCEECSQE